MTTQQEDLSPNFNSETIKKTTKEQLAKDFLKLGIEHALTEVARKYDEPPNLEDKQFFHDSEHSRNVSDTAGNLVAIMGGSEQAQLLAQFGGAFHDIYQNYTVSENGMRVRDRVNNEKMSAESAVKYLQRINEIVASIKGEDLFTEAEIQAVYDGITATTPGFGEAKNPANESDKSMTVLQPLLTESAAIITRCIAYADLSVWAVSPNQAHYDAISLLLLEDHVHRTVAMLKGDYSQVDASSLYADFLKAMQGQKAFFTGRYFVMNGEINKMETAGAVNTEQATELRKLYSKENLELTIQSIQNKIDQTVNSSNSLELIRNITQGTPSFRKLQLEN